MAPPDECKKVAVHGMKHETGHGMGRGACARLERFDGSGDVDCFLAHFEVVSQANAWTPETQLLQLPTVLDGGAFSFFRKLPVGQRDTVAKLKESLRAEYAACTLDTDYAFQLAGRRRNPGESIQDFGQAIMELSLKTYPTFSETQIDAVCRTHFINGVGEVIRMHLLMGTEKDESYRSLVKRARHLEQVLVHAPATTSVRRVREGDSSDGSDSLAQLQATVTQLASTVSDLTKKVSMMSVGDGRRSRAPSGPCPACGQTGHWRRECPGVRGDGAGAGQAWPAGMARSEIVCFKCKQRGHFARGCANF